MKRKHKTNGFTLIEALFAAMLIGLVVAAIAVSSGAATMANGVSIDLSTAEFLIEEIREQTASVDFDNILAYHNNTYNPPIDISGASMAEFSAFSQQVTVEYVNPSNLENVVTGPTDFVRITVTITKNNSPISSASWIRAQL
ncbi:MAG: prepilin-type N-terminal cleavage/methylation domain-containing protein [Phycisphaerae bacterium]|nr:prepilin-type N-terminal cleavage/methylation domain-containing protein [Phycisphaerae bacterium]